MSTAGSAIRKEFGLDNIPLGWLFSSFVLGYALFQAPGQCLVHEPPHSPGWKTAGAETRPFQRQAFSDSRMHPLIPPSLGVKWISPP